ncbi:MAG: SGNH/GDSL hydrolase family protein [Lachnospiraceae bacterium]|nr:SGNH/GDSL hydrolase family protein [Lachnospiraceae bacterium]
MKKIIFVISLLVLTSVAVLGFGRYREYQKQAPLRADYERIATEDYTAVFFSNYPIEHFTEEDFAYYRAIYPINASYCIPDLKTMNEYFSKVTEAGHEINTVYLGIRPDLITADNLLELISAWDNCQYQVIIAYPSLAYWKSLSEGKFMTVMSDYRNFITTLLPLYENNEWLQEHLAIYFYGSKEWLVANPANYESDFGVNKDISHTISMYSDASHGYQLTLENYETELDTFETLVTECRASRADQTPKYPDLSNWDVTFFGDSIMAFSGSNSDSISGVFSGLTHAHTYNCAQGGATATVIDGTFYGASEVIEKFLTQDLSNLEETSQMYEGMTDYFAHADDKQQKCFVLDFGMNDFFVGAPVDNPTNPYDVYTYAGSLRTAIDNLLSTYPDATILLVAPNFTTYFENGTAPQSAEGGALTDYIAAMEQIATEKNLMFYNSYTELGIDESNHLNYLVDGCHPNEAARFNTGRGLTKLFD